MCKDCGCEMAGEKFFKNKVDLKLNTNVKIKKISLEKNVLEKNDEIARKNAKWFADRKMKVVNLISSPGSGKTMLLEKTIERLQQENISFSILVGDQQTDNDAKRLEARGARVKQINTHSSCHLDAAMIEKEIALGDVVKGDEQLLIIENIGNLVCPAGFDLGEQEKIALLSTTEGEDKPKKYPVLFHNAKLIIITKMDLVPHLDWNLEKAIAYIREINQESPIITLSAKSGEGMDLWIDHLRSL